MPGATAAALAMTRLTPRMALAGQIALVRRCIQRNHVLVDGDLVQSIKAQQFIGKPVVDVLDCSTPLPPAAASSVRAVPRRRARRCWRRSAMAQPSRRRLPVQLPPLPSELPRLSSTSRPMLLTMSHRHHPRKDESDLLRFSLRFLACSANCSSFVVSRMGRFSEFRPFSAA